MWLLKFVNMVMVVNIGEWQRMVIPGVSDLFIGAEWISHSERSRYKLMCNWLTAAMCIVNLVKLNSHGCGRSQIAGPSTIGTVFRRSPSNSFLVHHPNSKMQQDISIQIIQYNSWLVSWLEFALAKGGRLATQGRWFPAQPWAESDALHQRCTQGRFRKMHSRFLCAPKVG